MNASTFWRRQDYMMRQSILRGLHNATPFIHGIVLDVGCGGKPYKDIIAPYSEFYIGIDLPAFDSANKEEKSADVYCNINEGLPFKDSSMNTIICTEVLEHVPNPSKLMREFYRVLKKGGYLILTTPQTWELHEEPYDYFRYTRHGLKALALQAQFEVVQINSHSGTHGTIIQLITIHLFNILILQKPKVMRIFFTLIGVALLRVGLILDKLNFNSKLSLGNTLVALKNG